MTKVDFEKFLEERAIKSGFLDGYCKDDMPDRFEAWLETKQIDDFIKYANDWGATLIAQTN